MLSSNDPYAAESRPEYSQVIDRLTAFIESEQISKELPALSIALVDDRGTIWSRGFGSTNPSGDSLATSSTVYRVGSVSKLFNALAIVKLAVEGKVDLDADVITYLPDFSPNNPFGTPITLRHLLSHQSGLVREPPKGSYFDPDFPSLSDTIQSLNETELVFEPGTRTKYSNAAVSVAGLVVERITGMPFEQYVQEEILQPLQMKSSSFVLTPAIEAKVPEAWMWSHHRAPFPAPTFSMGILPAGNLYSTVDDLSHLLRAMFHESAIPDNLGLSMEDLQQMIHPTSAQQLAGHQYGLGFRLGELDGHPTFGHGGAVYGFATQFKGLPDEKLGVVVTVAMDGANGTTNRIADLALQAMLAQRRGEPVPKMETTSPLQAGTARRLEGNYTSGDDAIEIYEYAGRAYLKHNYTIGEIRQKDGQLIVDDVLSYSPDLELSEEDSTILLQGKQWTLIKDGVPPECPERWRGLIGEYGWDHNTLYILEDRGQLWALIEWFYHYPLTEIEDDVFVFPDTGLYHDEQIVFSRDENGEATLAVAAGIEFQRRTTSELVGDVFTIEPIRPVEVLRKNALEASPPEETGPFLKPELVELNEVDPTIKYDIRYAGTRNFMGTPFYNSAHAYMQRPAAEAVQAANEKLAEQGYGLLVYDAYRPWFVTKMFWDGVPPQFHGFVADPSLGSRHNRGCAVDLTLYDLNTGEPIPTVAEYDEFSERAYPLYPGGTSRQRWHRTLLRKTMESVGFTVYPIEWWHFDFRNWQRYPIMNVTFEELSEGSVTKPSQSD